jgi:pimeloyl-ACP methyl ester carboxylesterase
MQTTTSTALWSHLFVPYSLNALTHKPFLCYVCNNLYGGYVISNAGANNPNVTGLVYIAVFAPDEGENLGTFVTPDKLPLGILVVDSAGLTYLDPDMFHEAFAQDVNATEAEIMAVSQKPFDQSIFASPSGPPAWKQLPTWYQVSESDRMIPPDTQHMFAQRMNATTISIDTSHSSYVAHSGEIAQLILDAAAAAAHTQGNNNPG